MKKVLLIFILSLVLGSNIYSDCMPGAPCDTDTDQIEEDPYEKLANNIKEQQSLVGSTAVEIQKAYEKDPGGTSSLINELPQKGDRLTLAKEGIESGHTKEVAKVLKYRSEDVHDAFAEGILNQKSFGDDSDSFATLVEVESGMEGVKDAIDAGAEFTFTDDGKFDMDLPGGGTAHGVDCEGCQIVKNGDNLEIHMPPWGKGSQAKMTLKPGCTYTYVEGIGIKQIGGPGAAEMGELPLELRGIGI